MTVDYEERLKDLFGEQLAPYQVSTENLATDRPLTRLETEGILNGSKYIVYARPTNRSPDKRRILVHMNSYYLPDFIRGMTDTTEHIWINAREYSKRLVLRHEKIHVAHPEWTEETVRQFHESYEPNLADVEFVYI